MTTALANLATRLTALETDLAGAATAAEVTALQTALAAAQADLTELLASNNVYSDNLTINSNATLAVAKSLGGKLAIINGSVTISQSSSMNAEDLQEVVDHMVTVTGSISYTMAVNGSTQAVFNNLTSVGNLTLDVSGAINFPVLENAAAIDFDNTHKNYVTSVEFPKLSKVTSFETDGTADTIDFSKATAITLTELANYERSSLTLNGKLDYILDLAKLTSKTAAGVKNAITLNIGGAKEVILPEFTDGRVVANNTEKVVLAKFKGSTSSSNLDSFSKAEYLHLEVYEQDYTSTSTSLETLIFGGVAESSDTTSAGHPSLDLTGATGLTTLTVKGALNDLTLDGNTSLTDVTVTGTINDVIVNGATSLETLVLGHTGSPVAATKDESSLTITGNTELTSLTVDAIVSLGDLEITGNTSLETISFAKLTGIGVDAVPVVDISNNNLSASVVEKDSNGTTSTVSAAGGVGSITTDSGMKGLKTYLGAAATKAAATAGASVYAAFDTVESYVDIDDSQSGPFTYTVTNGKGLEANAKLEVVYVTPATADSLIPNSYAEAVLLTDNATDAITFVGNGGSLTLTQLSTETAADFAARINGNTGLTNVGISTGQIDRRAAVEISATATNTTASATIIFGSAGYASATATPTSASLAKVQVGFTPGSTSVSATIADAIADALNGSSVYLESFNSSTYSNTDNYTTTTTLFSDKYEASNEDGLLVITKKVTKQKNETTSGTATTTVVDRTASAVSFTLFDTSDASKFTVVANSYRVLSNYYIKLTDKLYGSANTPGLNITQASAHALTHDSDTDIEAAIVEEFSAYDSDGAGTARANATGGTWTTGNYAAHSGGLTRATEFDSDDAVSANKKNITSWL